MDIIKALKQEEAKLEKHAKNAAKHLAAVVKPSRPLVGIWLRVRKRRWPARRSGNCPQPGEPRSPRQPKRAGRKFEQRRPRPPGPLKASPLGNRCRVSPRPERSYSCYGRILERDFQVIGIWKRSSVSSIPIVVCGSWKSQKAAVTDRKVVVCLRPLLPAQCFFGGRYFLSILAITT